MTDTANQERRDRVNERQLLERLRAGDRAAERELYERHVDRVYRLAYRLTGDDALAEDCTQETFVRAFSRVHDFRGDARLSTWLYRIAVTVTLNVLRKVRRIERREIALADAGVAGPARSAEPDLKARLARAIDALPEGCRVVFVMHDVEGYTHEEIGAALGVRDGTSKAQLSRARAKLRVALADFAGEWKS
ncbi:MAG TPA: sigma-70 family RNA polymerase sigma factor [Gemmatimonadaceae bacterium]|nr:sigma-70 family RNA polymerase sigma factor [Gemmatimonadaceae bacterium]